MYCVTGAAGYIGQYVVRALLERGLSVRGTVRLNTNVHRLSVLKKWQEVDFPGKLELVEADLLEPGSFDAAVKNCIGCFHTASPFFIADVTDPFKQLIRPAVDGTLNVLGSCLRSPSVKRVVLTSSVAAVIDSVRGPTCNWTFSEADWNTASKPEVSGLEAYRYSKTAAEVAAWKLVGHCAKVGITDDILQMCDAGIKSSPFFTPELFPSSGGDHHSPGVHFDLVTINPCMVIGRNLTTTFETEADLNTSSRAVLSLLSMKGANPPSGGVAFVDVADVAKAHVLAMLNPAAHGRYLCASGGISWANVAQVIREEFPQFDHLLPSNPNTESSSSAQSSGIPEYITTKLQSELEWNGLPVRAVIREQVQSFIDNRMV